MAVPVIIAAVAAAAQVMGSVMQSNSQAAGYNQQAKAEERNAQLSDIQARQAYDAGVQNELSQRRSGAQQLSGIRASVAESGLDPGSGSALLLQQQSSENLEMDALTTRYQGLLQGAAYEQQGVMDRYTASALRSSAKSAKRAGRMTAATGILTSAANYAGQSSSSRLGPSSSAATSGSGIRGGSGNGLRVGNASQYWG